MNEAKQVAEHIAQTLKERLAREGDHLQVKDKNGEHVGTVDHLAGDSLKLTRTDSTDGQHHLIPLSQVESMDDVAVYLNVTRAEVK